MAIKEASSTGPAAPTEEAVAAPAETVEESGGLAGYVMGAPGVVVPISVFDDPAWATVEETRATPTTTEETRIG